MSFSGPSFIVAIVMICTAGWIINNWIRARHGYPLENEWGGTTPKVDVDADRKITLLSSENETLNGKIGNLEERITVLERIVTDKAGRLSEEIERLR
ncbi:hypothetical protein [Sphingorhabdus sp.]|uniref:hypothetical protein n=1 Tax=Sphingorhabdus sp. TaxID=1902408 RepID=UPI00359471C3